MIRDGVFCVVQSQTGVRVGLDHHSADSEGPFLSTASLNEQEFNQDIDILIEKLEEMRGEGLNAIRKLHESGPLVDDQ